jgi:hypothetical protein
VNFDVSRLRSGEMIAGASATLLLALMLLAPWYGLSGAARHTAAALGGSGSVDGFDGLTHVRWLVLVTIATALGLTWLQVTRRAPALPVSFSVIVTVLGLLSVLALIYRVLINVPGPDSAFESKVGAYLGLVAACALTYGAFRSLREERPPDGSEKSIPIIELSRQV